MTGIHWHAAVDGGRLTAGDPAAGDAAVGFASWEDARECLLFAVVDRIVAAPRSDAERARREALLALAAGLEAARPGWRWAGGEPDAPWWLEVCTEDDCGCEVLDAPSPAAPAGRAL